jgi:hypothetical protein
MRTTCRATSDRIARRSPAVPVTIRMLRSGSACEIALSGTSGSMIFLSSAAFTKRSGIASVP